MQVTVAFVNPPKPGGKRWSIKDSNGSFWGFDNAKITLEKGKTYDIESTSSEFNGKTYHNITSAKSVGGGNGAATGGDRWYMPFVSNTVAHAIAAGLIKDASQIHIWAQAAKKAAISLETPAADYADDRDIPYA